ncbi:hypothetical protein [Nocardia salmonicida]|uniref:hypothetical protein n=1 Tax=Nocardia salmonicida TaxID=53431 RepID=UPI0007A4A7F9|nr:hypothetical protein [Nocardia salmonicida]MBC7299831.1 hypothetical protein [Nocardia sp.]
MKIAQNPAVADFRTANEILVLRHDDIPVDAYGRTRFTAFWLRDGEIQQQTCTHDLDAYINRVTRNSGREYRLI